MELSDASSLSPTFTAPSGLTENATLAFTLRMEDDEGLSAEDTVEVTVYTEHAPLTAEFDQMPSNHDGSSRFTFRLR